MAASNPLSFILYAVATGKAPLCSCAAARACITDHKTPRTLTLNTKRQLEESCLHWKSKLGLFVLQMRYSQGILSQKGSTAQSMAPLNCHPYG